MSAISGITVSPELASTFANAVQSGSTRFIKILIQNESLVHDISIPIDGSFEQDLRLLQRDAVLPTDSPAYILAKLDAPSSDWISIYYVPDTAQVREKMLYASTRFSLLKSLGSSLFTDSIFATSKEDLTEEAYASHLRHAAAPNPLSKREQELADLRMTENQTATYEGNRARASHIGSGVGLNWSEEAENAIMNLGEATESQLVIITIDPKTETLALHFSGDIEPDSLNTLIPSSEPCYALFCWSISAQDDRRLLVFIYSCPSQSPVKNRMIYSSGSASTFEAAKGILTSLSPSTTIASRKIETSDPTELTLAYIKEELGLSQVEQPPQSKIQTSKGFAKPRGPPRRR
ncbi:Twinfilin [Psilocybe cubensis]|uniref:Twinfilin n=1 Tax=Psilocybe cubensis TaxID=181762 RepID=A0ACB8HAE8_PSICU|nr:Twinfilin [Psilocybe cubensis]KAH9484130.1 Twinfilin [Psilocybe cubensis]